MRSTIIPATRDAVPSRTRSPVLDRLARRALHAVLKNVHTGRLALIDGAEKSVFGRSADGAAPTATIYVHDPRFYRELALAGSVGAGEAYMAGYWTCSDLVELVRLFVLNADVLDGMESGPARFTEPLRRALHWLHRNTRRGSRRNIAAHYDIGNDLFALFLDQSMMYSSAVFDSPDQSLEAAQTEKNDRICRKLDLGPGDHLLEIGTGWGGFAAYAATHYGCRVTTTTISHAQYALAVQRVHEAVLQDRVQVLLQDYRDLRGSFDKIVSIEMIEAVGHQYFETFFTHCSALLKPSGMMLLQAITVADQRYEHARRSVDFIKRHIFPGCCIPSVTALLHAATRASDLRMFHLEDIGPHYATTLRLWRERFFTNLDHVRALGYPDEFVRMWEFYLSYCEGGFAERAIGDAQMLLVKPGNRRAPVLGDLPARAVG